jgi:hypothetical protein
MAKQREPKPEAVWRTCACGGSSFALVGYQNATWLWCSECDAPPILRGRTGELGRGTMKPEEIAEFKARLGKGCVA